MKRIGWGCIAAVLLCTANVATAAGVNLRGNDCGAAWQENRTFACTSCAPIAGLLVGSSVAPLNTVAIVGYGAFKLVIGASRATGTGACAGCLEPVCLVLDEIRLTQALDLGNFRLQSPADVGNFVAWQGGVESGGCPAATLARNATWGAVKSLHR